jgi:hypothetical protein
MILCRLNMSAGDVVALMGYSLLFLLPRDVREAFFGPVLVCQAQRASWLVEQAG